MFMGNDSVHDMLKISSNKKKIYELAIAPNSVKIHQMNRMFKKITLKSKILDMEVLIFNIMGSI